MDSPTGSPSPLARHLGTLKALTPERRTDAALAKVAEDASRSLHQASQLHRPTPQRVLEGLPDQDRKETLAWLVQAYEVMTLPDATLFDTALLLDRYYSAQPRDDGRSGSSRGRLLAAVCIGLKTSAEDMQLPVRQVVAHLGRNQVPFDEVLAAEIAILKKLCFSVGTPTARNFLDALGTRVHHQNGSGVCAHLAEFLLQLTLVDAHLHYNCEHAALAASCLAVALFATGAPTSSYVALLEDLALHCPSVACSRRTLTACCADVHQLWQQSVGWHERGEPGAFARSVCTKFADPGRYAVSDLAPPPSLPASFPPQKGWEAER